MSYQEIYKGLNKRASNEQIYKLASLIGMRKKAEDQYANMSDQELLAYTQRLQAARKQMERRKQNIKAQQDYAQAKGQRAARRQQLAQKADQLNKTLPVTMQQKAKTPFSFGSPLPGIPQLPQVLQKVPFLNTLYGDANWWWNNGGKSSPAGAYLSGLGQKVNSSIGAHYDFTKTPQQNVKQQFGIDTTDPYTQEKLKARWKQGKAAFGRVLQAAGKKLLNDESLGTVIKN